MNLLLAALAGLLFAAAILTAISAYTTPVSTPITEGAPPLRRERRTYAVPATTAVVVGLAVLLASRLLLPALVKF